MNEENHIRAVIFDLGNVLINFDHRIAAKKISEFTKKDPQEIYSLFFDSGLTALFEEGKISPQDFFLKVKEALGASLSYEQFLSIWNRIFFLTKENQAVHDLAGGLASRYRVALLSNINILHFEYLKKNFSIFDPFRYVITSFEAGFRKPDPLIYRQALEKINVLPQEAFYTDDRPELIAGASRLGIQGFVFRGIEQLKKDLMDLGVKLDE